MLHSILGILTLLLTILKWLGLFLLSLLCLLLIVLLLVLLVPVRYRGRVEKTTEKLAGEITGTYLLRLIFVRASVDSGGGRMEICIAGKTLETWRELLKKRKHRRRNKGTRKGSAEVKQGVKQEAKGNSEVQKKEGARRNSEVRQEQVQRKPEVRQEQVQRKPEIRQKQATQKSQAVHEKQKSDEKERPFSDKKEAGEKREDSWISQIRGIWKSICGLVFGIRKKIASFWTSFSAMPDKIEAFFAFAEQYEVWELFGEGKKELLNLFFHYRPRHLTGYLKFGTGDPAQTGELTGLLYLLLPTGEYELLPDFEEMRFETETEFSGHIRSIHLLLTAWHLFRNQKLKRLIRKVRKKGE